MNSISRALILSACNHGHRALKSFVAITSLAEKVCYFISANTLVIKHFWNEETAFFEDSRLPLDPIAAALVLGLERFRAVSVVSDSYCGSGQKGEVGVVSAEMGMLSKLCNNRQRKKSGFGERLLESSPTRNQN